MSFTPSTAPDITEGLPASIGSTVLVDYPPTAGWDVTFGSLGFTLRPSDKYPYQRGTEDPRKQQIDTSDAPGEQSLSSWWVRSQDSWDMGTGIRWYEPGSVGETRHRYGRAFGVDTWTQGAVSLLHKMGPASSPRGAPNYVCGLEVSGVLGFVEAYGNQATWNQVIPGGTSTTVTLPGSNATQPAAAGGSVWVGHDGGVSKFTPGSPIATPITLTGNARVWWAKARLIVAVGPVLYEVPANTTTGVITTVGTVIYTHPTADWLWTDVTETAGAILASGYAGADSAIFRVTIENDTSGTPILTGAAQVGRTPPGERITAMSVYLGTSIVLGTSSGVRVGQVTDSGDVQYGPLTVATDNPVVDVTFRDRFAYLVVTAAQEGDLTGVVRVDLSAEVLDNTREVTGGYPKQTGRFAYAWDASIPNADDATSLCLVGERVVIAAGQKSYLQSDTQFVDQGWFNTGNIRFATVEPKAFRLVRTVVATNGGTASLTVTSPDGTENRVVDFDDNFRTEDDVALSIPGRPVNQYVSLTVYLTPSSDNRTPVLSALSVKAVPASSRVRLFQFPISVFDREEDRYGNKYGTDGGAYRRLAVLELAEESGRPISVVDNRSGEAFLGQIDSVTFTATTAPGKADSNFGGTALVQVRRL